MSQATLVPKALPFLQKGLLVYWKLEEAAATTRRGSHNRFHLSDTNSVTQETGKVLNGAGFVFGSGTVLSTTDEGIKIPNATVTSFTVAGWFKGSGATDWNFIVARQNEADNQRSWRVMWHRAGNRCYAYSYHDDGATQQNTSVVSPVAADDWMFFALRITPTTMNLRLGEATDAPQVTLTEPTNADATTPLSVGAGLNGANASSGVTGIIDELGVWGRILGEEDLTAFRNGGNGTTYPNFR